MRIVRAASQPDIPWKNGGGRTREIARFPIDASLESFDWRVSRAHVATDGPFSRFPDVDRTLLVLVGAGIRLVSTAFGAVDIAQESAPFRFDGGSEVVATLAGGPIDDLNVMTVRHRARHEVTRRTIDGPCELGARASSMVVVVEEGVVSIGGETASAGDAVVCESGAKLGIASHGGARLVVVDVWTAPFRGDAPPFRAL